MNMLDIRSFFKAFFVNIFFDSKKLFYSFLALIFYTPFVSASEEAIVTEDLTHKPSKSFQIIRYQGRPQFDVVKISSFFMQCSFRLELASTRLLSLSPYYPEQPPRHNLIIFNGTSCAGKTSLIHALRRYIPNSITLGMDATAGSVVFPFIEDYYKINLKTLRNEFGENLLYHLLTPIADNPYLKTHHFKMDKGTILHELEKIKELIQQRPLPEDHIGACIKHEIAERTRLPLYLGKVVFLDMVVPYEALSIFQASFLTLVYCPLGKLIERAQNRNLAAVQMDKPFDTRDLSMVVTQFVEMYEKASHPVTETSVHNQGLEILAARDYIGHLSPYESGNQSINGEIEKTQKLIRKYPSAAYAITYPYPVDIIVDTGRCTPEDGAKYFYLNWLYRRMLSGQRRHFNILVSYY